MVTLVLYFLTLMVGLRLVGIAALDKGKEDWHWWLIGLLVIGSCYGLGVLLPWLFGYSFSISVNDRLELSPLGMVWSGIGLYILHRILGGRIFDGDVEKMKAKVDEIGKDEAS